jgi:hypothetical protein
LLPTSGTTQPTLCAQKSGHQFRLLQRGAGLDAILKEYEQNAAL